MYPDLPAIFVSLPLLNEYENLFAFISNVRAQDYEGQIKLFVCVNQPDEWWNEPARVPLCHNNQKSIEFLLSEKYLDIFLIDRSSPGKGWKGSKHGVGFARRETMQAIAAVAKKHDIILSLDADTWFGTHYFLSVATTMRQNPHYSALSVPYYHILTGDPVADRAILHYEIYMRYYAINMLRINSPYAFTALGSAIAVTVKNYLSIGGITPKMSGEDFYFLQKLRKKGKIICWNPEKVYPAARFSDRVYFGTGPAMIKGANGDWSSYPIYRHQWFDEIQETYSYFEQLFVEDIPTPMDRFLEEFSGEENIWTKLRKNASSPESFARACHEKIDGLRVLQYLKWKQRQNPSVDEQSLIDFVAKFFPESLEIFKVYSNIFSFSSSPINDLDRIRNWLAEKEEALQKAQLNND